MNIKTRCGKQFSGYNYFLDYLQIQSSTSYHYTDEEIIYTTFQLIEDLYREINILKKHIKDIEK